MSAPRTHVSTAPPKPVTRPCPSCEAAVWRFNGRSWYAADSGSRKRHVCATPEVLARLEPTELGSTGRSRLTTEPKPRRRRRFTTGKVVAVTALAAFAGIYAVRAAAGTSG
jgi:hypothetical protein